MSWRSGNSGSSTIQKDITEIVNTGIRCVEYLLNKRIYVNIVVILLSICLVGGYYCSINNKEYWGNIYNTVTKETNAKVEIIGTTFATYIEKKLDTSINLAYSNSKSAINKKSFHQFPKVNIKSKTSLIDHFTKKSFNSIDKSKKFRLGELKWKLFSKIQ